MLTQERLKELLHYDPETGVFTWRISSGKAKQGNVAGTKFIGGSRQFYWRIRVDGKFYLAHRLAYFYMKGVWPKETIDHENNDGLDNRWKNLRPATYGQNSFNQRINKNNRTGLKGVSLIQGKFVARIMKAGKHYYLGRYTTAEAAHGAYRQAASQLHGDFANYG